MNTAKEHTNRPLLRDLPKHIMSVLDGTFLTRDSVLDNIPFILTLFGLGIVYIANSHWAERNHIETNRMKNELKELRSDFISIRSELMFVSKQSEVAKAVAPMGIYESVVPPKKIILTEEEQIH